MTLIKHVQETDETLSKLRDRLNNCRQDATQYSIRLNEFKHTFVLLQKQIKHNTWGEEDIELHFINLHEAMFMFEKFGLIVGDGDDSDITILPLNIYYFDNTALTPTTSTDVKKIFCLLREGEQPPEGSYCPVYNEDGQAGYLLSENVVTGIYSPERETYYQSLVNRIDEAVQTWRAFHYKIPESDYRGIYIEEKKYVENWRNNICGVRINSLDALSKLIDMNGTPSVTFTNNEFEYNYYYYHNKNSPFFYTQAVKFMHVTVEK